MLAQTLEVAPKNLASRLDTKLTFRISNTTHWSAELPLAGSLTNISINCDNCEIIITHLRPETCSSTLPVHPSTGFAYLDGPDTNAAG